MPTNLISVELLGGLGCREPHPLPRPVLPGAPSYQERGEYHQALGTYYLAEAPLARYRIESIECESGLVVSAKALNFKPYAGQTRSAVVLSAGVVRLVPTPKPTKTK